MWLQELPEKIYVSVEFIEGNPLKGAAGHLMEGNLSLHNLVASHPME